MESLLVVIVVVVDVVAFACANITGAAGCDSGVFAHASEPAVDSACATKTETTLAVKNGARFFATSGIPTPVLPALSQPRGTALICLKLFFPVWLIRLLYSILV